MDQQAKEDLMKQIYYDPLCTTCNTHIQTTSNTMTMTVA